ncbi:MAG: hypothetical protein GY697_16755 [Desulfobacterales bacterium]|nr:hypothetical protein [Desulfobacterales bacterium]
MKPRTSLTTTEKESLESYLETIRRAAELEEYEMALTAMESLKQIFLDKLMIVHHGGPEKQ